MDNIRGAGEVLASNIRAEMARRRITQEQAAEVIGLSQAGVSRRLNGRAEISALELQQFATLLDVPVASLLPQLELSVA